MKVRTISRVLQSRNRSRMIQFHSYRVLAQFHSIPKRLSFGIAFDIDGAILRGRTLIGDSPRALRSLLDDSGGGIPESRLASELNQLLEVNVAAVQVVQGYSPFKNLLKRFENELIVANGKGEPAVVMSEYSFKKVLSLDEYASYFNSIDPLSPYKTWTTRQPCIEGKKSSESIPSFDVTSERVKAAFVVGDPVAREEIFRFFVTY